MPVMKPATLAAAQVETKTVSPGLIAGVLVLTLLWVEVIKHLQVEWSHNPQYRYGWSVPFLAIYLGWKRWTERPRPERGTAIAPVVYIAGALLLFPLRFLAEANPD